MSIRDCVVERDHFEYDESHDLCFPCCVCKHNAGSDTDEPCRRCDHNIGAKPQWILDSEAEDAK